MEFAPDTGFPEKHVKLNKTTANHSLSTFTTKSTEKWHISQSSFDCPIILIDRLLVPADVTVHRLIPRPHTYSKSCVNCTASAADSQQQHCLKSFPCDCQKYLWTERGVGWRMKAFAIQIHTSDTRGSRLFAGFNIPEHKAPVASEEMKYLLTSLRISLSQMDCVNVRLEWGTGQSCLLGFLKAEYWSKRISWILCVCVCEL